MKTTTGLKMLLKSYNMTQGELAEQLGVSQSRVSYWATGRYKMSKDVQEQIIKIVKSKRNPVIETHVAEVHVEEVVSEAIPKRARTLEGMIKECKRYCLDTYGFEVIVAKAKK